MRQMFVAPQNPRAVGGDNWVENACGELHIVRRCLYKLVWAHTANRDANPEDITRVEFPEGSVFQTLSPQMVRGSSEVLTQAQK